jgi:hypothetical protein
MVTGQGGVRLLALLLCVPHVAVSVLPCEAPTLHFRPFGYHISGKDSESKKHEKRYEDRWCQVGASIATDAQLTAGRYAGFTVVDYGSDEGYFSLALATSFPAATIFSVDFNELFFGVAPREAHEKHRKRLSASHNLICHSQYGVPVIDSLLHAGIRARYALVLSIFHWLPLNGRAEFAQTLCKAVQTAMTTFIELPEWGKNTTVHWDLWQHWYGPEDMQDVLISALAGCTCNPSVQFLGENKIDYGPEHPSTTIRKIYRIDLHECIDPKSTCSDLRLGLQCDTLLSDTCIPAQPVGFALQYCNVGDFELSNAVLGMGYSSTVYAGTWLARQAALKVSRDHVAMLMSSAYSPQVKRSSGLKHLLIYNTTHPNLNIPVHMCRLPASNETIQVLPLLSGRLLRAVLPGGLTLQQALSIAEQVGSALAFLHKNNLVYFDLHTEQIMLQESASGYHAILLDVDQVQLLHRNKTVCRCWPGDAFFSHVNSPESLQNCNLRRCNDKVDTYMFGVLLRTLYSADSANCVDIACRLYVRLQQSCLHANFVERPRMVAVVERLQKLMNENATCC